MARYFPKRLKWKYQIFHNANTRAISANRIVTRSIITFNKISNIYDSIDNSGSVKNVRGSAKKGLIDDTRGYFALQKSDKIERGGTRGRY